ncbi:MAG: hypothetical protein FJ194_20120 [Gammaproteobacteria bacterium]|nr:hypothetical protein [Gammaproteobacteria bacterium]
MKARLPGLVLLLIAAVYAMQIGEIAVPAADAAEVMTPRTLPVLLATLLALIGLILTARPGRAGSRGLTALNPDPVGWLKGAGLLLLALAFALLLDLLGVLVSSALVLFAGLFLLNVRRPLVLVAVPLSVAFALWLLLSVILGIYLHPGELWWRDV